MSGGAGAAALPMPILVGDRAEAWLTDLEHRRSARDADDVSAVDEIVEAVREEGDDALRRLAETFDGRPPATLRVPPERCRRALEALPSERRTALERAHRNIRRFHEAQRREEAPVEIEPGVRAWREFRPIERVGIYAPGGGAAYPSSLLMAAVPARVAGCERVIACSPPTSSGYPHDPVMAAAALMELDALFAVGGAQAVAAMALGTRTISAVDKVVGPGGRWVNAAKLALFRQVAIDLPAGPSEVAVWADDSAPPDRAAAELLAQAEHGRDSMAVGLVSERALARRIAAELEPRLARTPRCPIAAESLAGSALLVAPDDRRAVSWVNRLAAEHLVLLREDAAEWIPEIRNAGSVFVGRHTPVAAGDYVSGTNHILPTGGRARGADGLSLDDFGRWVQFQRLDRKGLAALAPAVIELAEWEGLPAHAASVRVRHEDGGWDGTRLRIEAPPGRKELP